MKHFGESLKDSVVKLAKFLNSFVKSEDKIKEFIKQVKKIGTVLKWLAGILGLYVIGAKATALYTAIMNSSFIKLMFSMKGAAGAATTLATSLKTVRTAMISTGIGAVVVLLGFLISKLFETGDAMVYVADRQDKVNDAMVDTQTKMDGLTKSLESLTATRAKMEKMLKKEGDGLRDNAVLTEKYNRLKKQEAIDIKSINKHMKTYNKELVKEKDSLDDIKKATNELITAMKNKALATVFIDMQAVILKTKVEADIILEKMNKFKVEDDAFGGLDTFGSKNINRIIKNIEGIDVAWGTLDAGTRYGNASNQRMDRLNALLGDYGITISEFKSAIAGGYYDSEMKSLTEIIESQSKTNIVDLLIDTDDAGDLDPENKSVDAMYGLNEKMQKAVLAANVNAIKNEDDKQKATLAAQLSGVNSYMAQFKSARDKLKPEYISATNTRAKLLRQQEKLLFTIEAKGIENRRQSSKQAAVDLLLDKEKENKNFAIITEKDGELTLEQVTLTHENLNETLNKIDMAGNAELLANAGKYGQDLDKIEQQITAQSIKNKQDNLDVAVKAVDKGESEDTNTLDKMLALDQITEQQHQQYMLQMQRTYLNDKLAILNEYNQDASHIVQALAENEIAQIESKKEALLSYMGIIGSLGESLQGLADDEEESSAIRDAGIAITQAAAIAEQFLTLQNQLAAIGISLKVGAKVADATASKVMIPLSVGVAGANVLEGATAGASAGGFFLKGIGKAFAANPFAGLAILATAIGIIVAIRNMFKGADTGGSGGSDSVKELSSSDRASDGVYTYSAGSYEDGGIIPEYAVGGITNDGGGNTRNVVGMEVPTLGGGAEGSDLGGGRGGVDTSRPTGESKEHKGGYWTGREDAWKFKGGAGTEMDNKRTQCGEGYVYNKATGRRGCD